MKQPITPHILDNAGPRAQTAAALGVHRSAITRWAREGIPAERVVEVERVTGIPREQLRPDLFQKGPADALQNA